MEDVLDALLGKTTRPVAGVIVCEPKARWGPRLRHRLVPLGIAVREVRQAAICLETVRALPGSAILLPLAAERPADSVISTLELIDRIRQVDPDSYVIVVADAALATLEPWARELGAGHFEAEPADRELLVALMLRHLKRRRVGMECPEDDPVSEWFDLWSPEPSAASTSSAPAELRNTV